MFAVFRLIPKGTSRYGQKRTVFNSQNLMARENIPFYGALVGITALTFQIAVLYPWHHELSSQFTEIQVRFSQSVFSC
jgi:formate-dependent nitrite reductase membrane component NrfD